MDGLIKTHKFGIFAIIFVATALIGSVVAIAGDKNAAFAIKKNQMIHFKISLKRVLQEKAQNVFQMIIV